MPLGSQDDILTFPYEHYSTSKLAHEFRQPRCSVYLHRLGHENHLKVESEVKQVVVNSYDNGKQAYTHTTVVL